jgi:hypothetical protein
VGGLAVPKDEACEQRVEHDRENERAGVLEESTRTFVIHRVPWKKELSEVNPFAPEGRALVGGKKYSDRRSRSCKESAIASPCDKRWSCHNASACG